MKSSVSSALFLSVLVGLALIHFGQASVSSANPPRSTAQLIPFEDDTTTRGNDVTLTNTLTETLVYLPLITKPMPTQSVPAEVAACQLAQGVPSGVGMGFATPVDRAPTLGTMRAKVLFVDFADAPASGTTEEHFTHLTQTAGFYNQLSYGRMNLQLEPVYKWYRMNESAADWDATFRTPPYSDGARRTIQLADPEVDFSGVDVVYILTSSTYPYVLNAAHYPPPSYIVADGNDIRSVTTGSADMNQEYAGPRIMMHEFGHNLGLPDLYSYDGHNDFLGQWDTMANTYGPDPTMIAYSRWKFGWLDDNQIYCQQTNQESVYLSALEEQGGVKAVMVPLSSTKMVVVESRRSQAYKQGALVYLIDTTIDSGQGAVVAFPDRGIEKAEAALVAGESVTVEGVMIEVLEAGDGYDLVRVTGGSAQADAPYSVVAEFNEPFSLIDVFPFAE